jgi:periplasmic protein TonB
MNLNRIAKRTGTVTAPVALATMMALAGCSSKKLPQETASTPEPTRPLLTPAKPVPVPSAAAVYSDAKTPEQYRIDLAKHVMAKSAKRVLATPLPNPLHGIAVVEMTISRDGRLMGINALRIPSHAPETRGWINELMAAASPLPQPQFATAGKTNLVVTETWFFMPDGKFHMRALQPAQQD